MIPAALHTEYMRVAGDIAVAAQRHKDRYGPLIGTFLGAMQEHYDTACTHTLAFLAADTTLAPYLRTTHTLLDTILRRNAWIGWELCDLGPVLGIAPAAPYAYAMLAYNALHLIDDGIDGHTRYEAIDTPSLYGLLLDLGHNERAASATSSMLGMALINESARVLLEKDCPQIAGTILRLACRVYTGMMLESLCDLPLTVDAYRHIVSYKSVAYQMFLDHVFLWDVPHPVRHSLLRSNAGIVRLGQLVDDLQDNAADTRDNRMTVLAVPDIDRQACLVMAVDALREVWDTTLGIDGGLRDATAVRLLDWIRLLDEQMHCAEAL